MIHRTLPDGAYKARYEAEFYVLRERKKVMYEDNRTLHVGLRYLIWSSYSRRFYVRTVKEHDDGEDYRYYVGAGYLWIYPTEENKDAIREDVERHGLGYYALQEKRQTEVDHERHIKYGNKGDGWQYKQKIFRKIRYEKND